MQVSNDGFEDGSSQADPRHAHDRPMTSLKGPIRPYMGPGSIKGPGPVRAQAL